jgi:uncharacterized DUF497 family protein
VSVRFEWDEAKEKINARKHGVSFIEARRLFESGEYLEIYDADHSEVEDRFIAIGPIARGVLVVVYTESDEDVVRVLGARFATRRERGLYQMYLDRFE